MRKVQRANRYASLSSDAPYPVETSFLFHCGSFIRIFENIRKKTARSACGPVNGFSTSQRNRSKPIRVGNYLDLSHGISYIDSMDALFDFQTAKAYVAWWKQSEHRAAVALQSQLMIEMLQPLRGKSALVIGCGNHTVCSTLLDAGLSVTCIDNSPYLLDIAEQSLGKRIDFLRYDGDDMPFSDNAFHYATLFCALEFLPDPFKTLEEVFRVTRNRVFIALFNPYATSGFRRQMMRIFPKEKHHAIHVFTCSQLKRAIRAMLGRVPVTSCYASFFPQSNNWMSRTLDHAACMRRLPFGTFSLLTASVVPRFRTRPLVVNYREAEKRSTAPMPVQMGCDPSRRLPANFDGYPPPESLQDISAFAGLSKPSFRTPQPSTMGRKTSHGSDPVSESR